MAAPLLDENSRGYSLNRLGKKHLQETKDESLLEEAAQAYGVNPKSEMYKLPPQYVGPYAEQDAALTFRLWQLFKKGIHEENIEEIYALETSLLPVLIEMRQRGVRIDLNRAEEVNKKLLKQEEQILNEIKRLYGVRPELWAAASVAQVFDRAGLEYPKTPKISAPSFTSNWLDSHEHKLPKMIGQARKLNKAGS